MRQRIRSLAAKIRARPLFGGFVALCVLLALCVLFIANDVPHGATLPSAMWPVVYAILLMVIPIMLLRVSRWEYFGAVQPDQAVKMLLGALGVAVVLFWITQGYLAARLKVDVSGEVHPAAAQDKRVVLVSVHIANIGNSNTSVREATLSVVTGSSNTPCGCDMGIDQLQLEPGDKDPKYVRIGLDSPYYTLVWGTEEMRQVAWVCPVADFYQVALEVRVQQALLNTPQTWRASAVVTTQEALGRSPSWPAGEAKSAGLVESVKKAITGESK